MQFINLELSTVRFRINPNEEQLLLYEADTIQDGHGSGLSIEIINNDDQSGLVVWTREDRMFFAGGRLAPQDFSRT